MVKCCDDHSNPISDVTDTNACLLFSTEKRRGLKRTSNRNKHSSGRL